jgi:H+/Cl- antiporter ClcA
MREWWHDLLIELAGGVGAALIAAALIALAAHYAKFFKSDVDSNPPLFALIIIGFAVVIVVLITIGAEVL